MTSLLSSALEYQKRGASIIPVGSDKKPLIPWKEYQARCASEQEVTAWWSKFPNANIGLVTGRISNLAVVDVEKGGDISRFPETDTVETGGGGWHLYYAYAEGIENKARVFPLTDVRGEGGYVVAPPSVHLSGEPYKIIKKIGRQPFPKELFGASKTANWTEVNNGAAKGERNVSMARFIGRFMRAVPPSEWQTLLWPFIVWQNSKNQPPLAERELETIFKSIGKRAVNDKREIEESKEEAPVLPLSEVAKYYVKQEAEVLPMGISKFDEAMLGGFMKGDLITITGQTGQGKTTFAQTLTYNLVQKNIPSVWFSYEVLLSELWRKFKAMGVSDDMICYAPLKNVSGNIRWIEQKITEAKEKYGIKIAFIDHLGYLTKKLEGPDSQNFSAYLGSICRELKTIAIDYGITIVLLAHVRKIQGGGITSDDIGHSVGIAQESDVVFVVKRKRSKDPSQVFTLESAVKIEKNRRTGSCPWLPLEMIDGILRETHDELEINTDDIF